MTDDVKPLTAAELEGVAGILATPKGSARRADFFVDDELLARLLAAARAGHELASIEAMQRHFGSLSFARLAGEVCRLIDNGSLDARSPVADALLDYASVVYGDHDPIGEVRRAFAEATHRRGAGGKDA